MHDSCPFETLNLSHNSYGHQLMDNEYPIVWHEPVLDLSWDQLEAEIDLKSQLDIVGGIKITNVEMKKERIAAFAAIFRIGRATNSSTFVNFINANLCGEGILSLSKLVDGSPELRRLHLIHNRIDNMNSARCLSRSLKSHACVNELHLGHCDIGSSPEILLVILQSDVSIINLEHNNIESLGAAKIAQYLEDDPPIRRIDLECNRLNDGDIIHISQALKRNTNLKTIRLHTNNFTSISVKALLNCVFDGSTLNAISESNNTLTRINMYYGHNRLADCIDSLLEMNRTQKILLALQDKDSLLNILQMYLWN